MIVRYTCYNPANRSVSPLDIKAKLPAKLASVLYTESPFAYGIFTDTSNEEVIRSFDKIFRIGSKYDYTKHNIVEITKDELDQFDYYHIMPRVLEPTGKVKADHNADSLEGFISTIRVKKELAGPHSIYDLWNTRRETILIITAALREVLMAESVSGLTYYELNDLGNKEDPQKSSGKYYAAVIDTVTHCVADHMIPDPGSDIANNIVSAPYLFGERYPKDDMPDIGFLAIGKILVGKQTYYFAQPRICVSRQVVKLLLSNKVKGLHVVARKLKKTFIPIVLS